MNVVTTKAKMAHCLGCDRICTVDKMKKIHGGLFCPKCFREANP